MVAGRDLEEVSVICPTRAHSEMIPYVLYFLVKKCSPSLIRLTFPFYYLSLLQLSSSYSNPSLYGNRPSLDTEGQIPGYESDDMLPPDSYSQLRHHGGTQSGPGGLHSNSGSTFYQSPIRETSKC